MPWRARAFRVDECKENRAYDRSDNRLQCNSRTGSSAARRRLIRRSLKTPRARYANQRDRAFSLPGRLHQPNEATDGKRTRQLPVAVPAWRLPPRRYIAHRHVLALTSRHRRTPRERGASTCNVASCCPGLAPGACDVGRRSQQHLSSTRKRRGPAISRAVRGTPNPRWGIAAALEGVSDAVSSRGAPASKPRRGRDDWSTCRRSCTLTTNTPTH